MSALLAGLTVLVIGDSHLVQPGSLVSSLHDALMLQGATVHTYGACGVAAADWTRKRRSICGSTVRSASEPAVSLPGTAGTTTPYAQLQEAIKPDLVVVVMGDTMGGYGNPELPKAWIWSQVSTLTGALRKGGKPCVWVGPPWGTEGGVYRKTYARVSEMSAYLAEIVAPCTYVDSTGFAKPGEWRSLDGQHFTSGDYRRWGDAIAASIAALYPRAESNAPKAESSR